LLTPILPIGRDRRGFAARTPGPALWGSVQAVSAGEELHPHTVRVSDILRRRLMIAVRSNGLAESRKGVRRQTPADLLAEISPPAKQTAGDILPGSNSHHHK